MLGRFLLSLTLLFALGNTAGATPVTLEAIKAEISWADEEISLANARIKQLKTIKSGLKKLSKVAKGGIAVDETAIREITSRTGLKGGKTLSKVPSLPKAGNVRAGEMFR
jgi:hypothetical protein